jgi:glycogen(starch) synthase
MRILRVAQKLYPDTKGGGQYHVHAMSRDQAAMGHDVTVVTTKEDEDLPNREETHGYEVVRLPKGMTVGGNDISPAMARYLWNHAEEYDVVHAHSHLYFSTNLTAIVRRLGDVPLAITNHGLYSQSAPEWVFDAYLRTLGKWTFNQADMVFCYTNTDKARLRTLGVRSRIEVVPNGIDTERFTRKGPESELIDAEGPVVLFVGRLVEGKHPKSAIRAFTEVLEEYPEAELYFCGEGPLDEVLQAQVAELGIEESVRFLGHIPYDEMADIYRGGDVLVLPSRAEGVPRSVIEAMATGLPVVVSDLDQLTTLVPNEDQRVEIGNDEDIAGAVCASLSESVDESLRERVLSEYDWQQTVGQTTRVLYSLVR